ncbi:MAG: 30S ribosomal protein S9 [Pseudonocardiales bacterium]
MIDPGTIDNPGTIDPGTGPPANIDTVITPSEDPRDAVTAPEIPQQTDPPAVAPPAPAVSLVPVISDRSAQTVGRRKQAIVRVRLVPGTGVFTLNGTSLEKYFPNKVHQQLVREPLLTVNKPEAYDVIGNLAGGGTSGQAGALRLGIARALVELNIDDRPALKKAGFLTRDARVKERKKYGLKKARKAPQYSKR